MFLLWDRHLYSRILYEGSDTVCHILSFAFSLSVTILRFIHGLYISWFFPFFFKKKLPNSTLLLGHSIVCLFVVAIDTWDAELRLKGEGGGIFLSSEMHSVSWNDATLHSECV